MTPYPLLQPLQGEFVHAEGKHPWRIVGAVGANLGQGLANDVLGQFCRDKLVKAAAVPVAQLVENLAGQQGCLGRGPIDVRQHHHG